MLTAEEYRQHDATGLAALVARGTVSPAELLDTALAVVEAHDPVLGFMASCAPETARRLIAEGLPDGPLRGVPFLLKDNGAEAADFPQGSGSRLLLGTRHTKNSTMYARLRAAGLVPFGRTTVPEGCVGPTTEAAVYGRPTRNPWALDRTSGGSSGGAGAAVAAGVVPAAHGSDGGGSIRIPASNCGLFGMKPTRARLPDGPFAGEGWAGMAIEGFLTRSVRDTAALLDACAGPDRGAPYWAPPLATSHCAAIARRPRRLRIAVAETTLDGAPIHPECRVAVIEAASLLESLGHSVEPAAPQADHAGMMLAWTRIVACGTALWVRQARARRGGARPGDVEQVTEAACRYAAGLRGADYLEAVETIHAYGRAMAAFFDRHDILLTATLAEPPALIGRFAHDRFDDFEAYRLGDNGIFPYSPFTAAANATGQPAASLPLHWTASGLPVGVHLAAAFGADLLLMALSAQIEAAAPWFDRVPPVAVVPQ